MSTLRAESVRRNLIEVERQVDALLPLRAPGDEVVHGRHGHDDRKHDELIEVVDRGDPRDLVGQKKVHG